MTLKKSTDNASVACYTEKYLLLLLLLSASPYSGSPQRESIFHFSRSTLSPSLAPTLSMSSLAKFFYLAPPSPSSFFPRSLLLSFSRGHTSVALHSEVCLLSLQSLSRIRFLSCPFLSLPVAISPFSTLQLPFFLLLQWKIFRLLLQLALTSSQPYSTNFMVYHSIKSEQQHGNTRSKTV